MTTKNITLKECGGWWWITSVFLLAFEYAMEFLMEAHYEMRLHAGYSISASDIDSLVMQFGILDMMIRITFAILIVTTPIALYELSFQDSKGMNP